MNNRLNKYKYPGAKRLMLEAQELKDNTEDYCAQPIDDNLFEWHFTVRGPPETAFDGGYYHGRLSFPTEYPMKPPSIILFTPNGRFETNKKICLSISGYHPETWQPSWSVRTALLALIAFMPTKANRAIGSLDFSDAERRKLARESRTWRCDTCGLIKDLLVNPDSAKSTDQNGSEESERCSEPSTSRVGEGPSSTSQSANNPNNNEENIIHNKEQSDSISNNIEGSGSQASIYSSSSNPKQQSASVQSSNQVENSQAADDERRPGCVIDKHQQHSSSGRTNVHRLDPHPATTTVVEEPRRAYPPLVLKSIFVLLSLLILRRVVMVIQA